MLELVELARGRDDLVVEIDSQTVSGSIDMVFLHEVRGAAWGIGNGAPGSPRRVGVGEG